VPKRNLRVTKWIGTVPAECVCTACGRLFQTSMTDLKRILDAQATLKAQFDEHECDLNAARAK